MNETEGVTISSLAASPIPSLSHSAVLNEIYSGPAEKKKECNFVNCFVNKTKHGLIWFLWCGGFRGLKLEREEGKSKKKKFKVD